jgi:hypothetical protein
MGIFAVLTRAVTGVVLVARGLGAGIVLICGLLLGRWFEVANKRVVPGAFVGYQELIKAAFLVEPSIDGVNAGTDATAVEREVPNQRGFKSIPLQEL